VRERPEAAPKSGEHAQFAAQRHDRSEQGHDQQTDIQEHATSQKARARSFSAARVTGDLDRREAVTSRRPQAVDASPNHVQITILSESLKRIDAFSGRLLPFLVVTAKARAITAAV
jgi:hypothetical protein